MNVCGVSEGSGRWVKKLVPQPGDAGNMGEVVNKGETHVDELQSNKQGMCQIDCAKGGLTHFPVHQLERRG